MGRLFGRLARSFRFCWRSIAFRQLALGLFVVFGWGHRPCALCALRRAPRCSWPVGLGALVHRRSCCLLVFCVRHGRCRTFGLALRWALGDGACSRRARGFWWQRRLRLLGAAAWASVALLSPGRFWAQHTSWHNMVSSWGDREALRIRDCPWRVSVTSPRRTRSGAGVACHLLPGHSLG